MQFPIGNARLTSPAADSSSATAALAVDTEERTGVGDLLTSGTKPRVWLALASCLLTRPPGSSMSVAWQNDKRSDERESSVSANVDLLFTIVCCTVASFAFPARLVFAVG